MSDPRITIEQLLAGLAECSGDTDLEVTGLALDSRQVRSGDAFVALAGEKAHGLDYLEQAAAAGAVALIHDGERALPADCPLPAVRIAGLAGHLPLLAGRMWPAALDGMDLVAVTGTNGKTSVAWLLAQALDGAMIGTLGSGRPGEHRPGTHTTPDVLGVYRTLAGLAGEGLGTVVIEASSHALVQGRLSGLSFTSVIFTTLGHDHLDYHAGPDEYAEAKAMLFSEFSSRRQLVNLDDSFGAELAGRLAGSDELIGYSLAGHESARATARLLDSGPEGLVAEMCLDGQSFEVGSKLLGRINLWNLLVVGAELHARGSSPERIGQRIAALEPVPGRMQPIIGRAGRLALIDYAHTPEALENALGSARELARHELWCLFGCGGERDRGKRARMGRVAESLADHVVLTDDNPRGEDGTAIIREIQAGMERPERSRVIRDRAAAIDYVIKAIGEGDVVLIAGKGHETDQVIGDKRLPFSDAEIARHALEAAA